MSDGRCFVALGVIFVVYLCSIAEVDSSDGCRVGNKLYRVGQEWSSSGKCQKNTCYEGGSIGAVTCPMVALSEDSKCTITAEDPAKGPYPYCCGEVNCPPDE